MSVYMSELRKRQIRALVRRIPVAPPAKKKVTKPRNIVIRNEERTDWIEFGDALDEGLAVMMYGALTRWVIDTPSKARRLAKWLLRWADWREQGGKRGR